MSSWGRKLSFQGKIFGNVILEVFERYHFQFDIKFTSFTLLYLFTAHQLLSSHYTSCHFLKRIRSTSTFSHSKLEYWRKNFFKSYFKIFLLHKISNGFCSNHLRFFAVIRYKCNFLIPNPCLFWSFRVFFLLYRVIYRVIFKITPSI